MSTKIVSREWKYWKSTDSIEYSISHSEYRYQIPESPIQCRFMSVDIADEGDMLIKCLVSTEEEEHCYYQSQEEEFTALLRSQHPDISCADAGKVTETFMEILQIANAAHCCPDCNPPAGGLGTTHMVSFKIQPLLSQHRHHLPAAELIIPPSSDDDVDEDELCEIPATRASIMELLKASSSSGNLRGVCECGICMEEIQTSPLFKKKTVLRMPCSHSFHRLCLLHWLNKSHSCPLCRYRMPAAQFRS